MENIFDLNIFEDTELKPISGNSYYELCTIVRDYDRLMDNEIYFDEAVRDTQRSAKRSLDQIISNTIDTTRDVVGLYDDTTTAGGSLIKAGWDLAMKLVKLAVRGLILIINLLTLIPTTITRVIESIENSAIKTMARIKGNITLYITYEDIKFLNDEFIFKTIKEIISAGVAMGKTQTWGNGSKVPLINKEPKSVNYKAIKGYCNKIINGRARIKNMRFDATSIDLSSTKAKELYLGTGSGSYLDSIRSIIKAIEDDKTNLDTLAKDFKSKYEDAIYSGAFATLRPHEQKRIQQAVIDLSKTTIDVSKIVNYANKDVNTIIKTVNKIKKSEPKQPSNNNDTKSK